VFAGTTAMAAGPFDQMFVRNEAQRSLYEGAIARLAQSRATRTDVRSYASTVLNDHEAYDGALRELAKSKGISLPSGLTKYDKKRLAHLAGLHGRAFDNAFIREARRVNDDDIRDFRKEASHAADPETNRFVTQFLEVDKKHEAGARALGGRDVASRGPVIEPPPTGNRMPVISPPSASAMPVIKPSDGSPR